MRPPSLLSFLFAAWLFVLPVSAQSHTSEQSEAQISDPNQECTRYTYAPVANAVAKGQFPPVWTIADIIPNDTNALAKYQSIQSQILDIPPNGVYINSTNNATLGNWTGYSYPSTNPNCWWTYSPCTIPKHPGLPPDIAVVPEPNTLGYGFDDGPNCTHNAFYNFLTQNHQKATMFYIGSNTIDWPYEAQRALADGHEICVHTWSHRYMTALNSTQVFAELYYTMQAIKLVVGVTCTCWRPPFGDVDDRVRSIAHALGLRTIIWKYDSNDWRVGTGNITAQDVDNNYNALIARAENGTFDSAGTIMLTHELNNYTMSEAMAFYLKLKSAFKYLVPINIAMNVTQPYVETNYSLPNFEQYIAGTTSLSANGASPTGSSGQSFNSAHPSFSTLGGLVATGMLMGAMLRMLM